MRDRTVPHFSFAPTPLRASTYAAGRGVLRAWLAAAVLACSGAALAQSSPCTKDPERHAQLAEQDTVQLYELQARHGRHEVSDRARRVFTRLQNAWREADPGSAWIDWRLRGYGAASPNAHALHTGTVLMTRGLDDASVPEDALAASLAHEMGHVLLRHGIEQACFALQAAGPTVLALRLAQADVSVEAWSPGSELGQRVRALSHLHELQADAWAVQLLARAGFAPDAMSQLFSWLVDKRPTASGLSAGTHPTLEARARLAEKVQGQLDAQAPSQSRPLPPAALLKTAAPAPGP
jgi:predicted Zn-dependent protease